MSEESGKGHEITRFQQNTQEAGQRVEKMELPTAQKILRTVVSTSEDKYTDQSSINKIGEFTAPQVRQAFDVVSANIMTTRKAEGSLFVSTKKDTHAGKLSLKVFKKISDDPALQRPESLNLSLSKEGNFLLESMLPLRESESLVVNDSMRFADFRGEGRVVSAYELGKEFTLEKYRHMWRGIRWAAANILDWDREGVIMPEELDTAQYSPSQITEEKKEPVTKETTYLDKPIESEKTKIDLSSIKSETMQGVVDQLEALRGITRASGVEVGGCIGVRDIDGKKEYFIESLD